MDLKRRRETAVATSSSVKLNLIKGLNLSLVAKVIFLQYKINGLVFCAMNAAIITTTTPITKEV